MHTPKPVTLLAAVLGERGMEPVHAAAFAEACAKLATHAQKIEQDACNTAEGSDARDHRMRKLQARAARLMAEFTHEDIAMATRHALTPLKFRIGGDARGSCFAILGLERTGWGEGFGL